jgi:hypothetical protein
METKDTVNELHKWITAGKMLIDYWFIYGVLKTNPIKLHNLCNRYNLHTGKRCEEQNSHNALYLYFGVYLFLKTNRNEFTRFIHSDSWMELFYKFGNSPRSCYGLLNIENIEKFLNKETTHGDEDYKYVISGYLKALKSVDLGGISVGDIAEIKDLAALWSILFSLQYTHSTELDLLVNKYIDELGKRLNSTNLDTINRINMQKIIFLYVCVIAATHKSDNNSVNKFGDCNLKAKYSKQLTDCIKNKKITRDFNETITGDIESISRFVARSR